MLNKILWVAITVAVVGALARTAPGRKVLALPSA